MIAVVEKADLRRDRQAIIHLHRNFLTPSSNDIRFEWLYCTNPCGLPLVWIVQDAESGEAIGTAAAFPRFLRIGTKKEIGWILGDFCISDAYRSLGPALQLQRKCLEGVGLGTNSIWYDFPSQKMLAIYKRLKIFPSGKMIRFVKPLRVNRKVGSWVKSEGLQKCLSRFGNRFLSWTTKKVNLRKGLTFHSHKGECGDEFTQLSEEIGGQIGNCLERTASYLNWRYTENPLYPCEMVTARLQNQLKGFIVFADMEGDVMILDLFGRNEQDVILGLIGQVVDRVCARGYEALSVSISEGHIWVSFFESFGFKPRDMDPVIIHNPMFPPKLMSRDYEQVSLLLMQGDRDV